MGKVCIKCGIEKPATLEYFHKHSGCIDSIRNTCKICVSINNKNHRLKNKDHISKNNKEYYLKNIEHKKKYAKEYFKNNKDKINKTTKLWKLKNKELCDKKHKEYVSSNLIKIRLVQKIREKDRLKSDLNFKLTKTLRCRILNSIKRLSGNKSISTIELLGCTIETARKHIESQFTDGMSWDNHGLKGWHIDHIMPCASFDLTDIEQQKICFNYKNLQPLWWYDNLRKRDKIL